MDQFPDCPKCKGKYVYEDGGILICPECGYEFSKDNLKTEEKIIKDANGNILKDGDSITVIKDLKLKGSSSVIKVGTKIKNIKLKEGDHNIDCKIPGIGSIELKSEFVKKI